VDDSISAIEAIGVISADAINLALHVGAALGHDCFFIPGLRAPRMIGQAPRRGSARDMQFSGATLGMTMHTGTTMSPRSRESYGPIRPRRSALGHEDQFPSPSLSGCFRLG
jgi:hypothetical protein